MKIRAFIGSLLFALSVLGSQVLAEQMTVKVSVSPKLAATSDSQGLARFSEGEIQYLSQPGEPDLPYQIVRVLLPPEADLSTSSALIRGNTVEEVVGEWDVQPKPPAATWDGTKVIEVWPAGERIEDGRNVAVYGKDARFPQTPIRLISSGQLRKWKLLEVPVALYQYNPMQKRLYRLVEAELAIEFSTTSIDSSSTPSFSDRIGESYVKGVTINFDSVAPSYQKRVSAETAANQQGRYVIITTANIVAGSTQLLNFVSSKEIQGFTVQVVTEATWGGGTGNAAADNIRNWLVANAASLNIEYVLLIGNPNPSSGDVPMKLLWPRKDATSNPEYQESPSDYYYADLTGNWDLDGDGFFGEWNGDFGPGGVDKNWEVLVGRIPFYGNFTDLDNILAKIIAYKGEPSGEGAWRKKVLLPMEPSDASTPGYHLGEAISNSVVVPKTEWGYHRVYEQEYGLVPVPETVPCSVGNVTNVWNASLFGAIFWWTHGSSLLAADVMDLSHAATLDDNHPGFTFQCSCQNSWPEDSSNLSYSLLRNGAVNTVGATRVSWYYVGQTTFAGSGSNSGMTYEYARRLITSEMDSGHALLDLKQAIIPSGPEMWMNWTGFNIYGDPSLGLFSFSNLPTVTSFALNNGASSTTTGTATLNNSCTDSPTHYMASESPSFTGAAWHAYATAPSFILSSGYGTKTVYFKVQNAFGESAMVSDAIELMAPTNSSLTVSITPQGAVAAGAQWRVDGGSWQSSGTTVPGLGVGQHTVEFKDTPGWTKPANQSVTITNNQATTVSGAYVLQTGSLTVTITPQGAVTAGAQWRVDGGAWQSSSATVSGLSIGSHTLQFKPITDWNTPASQPVTINNWRTTSASGTYVQQSAATGSLQVAISPPASVTAGAQWKVSGDDTWRDSGLIVSGLSVGQHTLQFNDVAGWTTPAIQTVIISSDQTTWTGGAYVQQVQPTGSFKVTLKPKAACARGANWKLDKGAWKKSGETLSGIAPGVHIIRFKRVTGWKTPVKLTVTIAADRNTKAKASYAPR